MANPRYPQPQPQRVSPREQKLSELGALLNMSNAAQGPVNDAAALEQRGQQGRQQAMISLLQLMSDQQAQAQRATQQGQALDIQRQELGQRDATNAVHTRGNELSALVSLAEHGDPAAIEALGKMIPSLGGAQQQQHQGAVQKGVQGILPGVQQLYKENKGLPQALAGLEPGVNPEVWNALPWNDLNAGLGAPQPDQGSHEGLINFLTAGTYGAAKAIPPAVETFMNQPPPKPEPSGPPSGALLQFLMSLQRPNLR